MTRRYLPTADGQIVAIGRTRADVMPLLDARLHLMFVERMAANPNPVMSGMFAQDATDLLWAISEAKKLAAAGQPDSAEVLRFPSGDAA